MTTMTKMSDSGSGVVAETPSSRSHDQNVTKGPSDYSIKTSNKQSDETVFLKNVFSMQNMY